MSCPRPTASMEATAICPRASGCGAGFYHVLVRYGPPFPSSTGMRLLAASGQPGQLSSGEAPSESAGQIDGLSCVECPAKRSRFPGPRSPGNTNERFLHQLIDTIPRTVELLLYRIDCTPGIVSLKRAKQNVLTVSPTGLVLLEFDDPDEVSSVSKILQYASKLCITRQRGDLHVNMFQVIGGDHRASPRIALAGLLLQPSPPRKEGTAKANCFLAAFEANIENRKRKIMQHELLNRIWLIRKETPAGQECYQRLRAQPYQSLSNRRNTHPQTLG
jgi:hypothetical protein